MIRKARLSDIEAIGELLEQIQSLHAVNRPDLFKAGTRKYSAQDLQEILGDPGRPVFVYETEDGGVVGYVFCIVQRIAESRTFFARTHLYIDDLCVDEHERGKGIGTALYRHALRIAREENADSVTLNVWNFNAEAVAFYRKCGMVPMKMTMEQKIGGGDCSL